MLFDNILKTMTFVLTVSTFFCEQNINISHSIIPNYEPNIVIVSTS